MSGYSWKPVEKTKKNHELRAEYQGKYDCQLTYPEKDNLLKVIIKSNEEKKGIQFSYCCFRTIHCKVQYFI